MTTRTRIFSALAGVLLAAGLTAPFVGSPASAGVDDLGVCDPEIQDCSPDNDAPDEFELCDLQLGPDGYECVDDSIDDLVAEEADPDDHSADVDLSDAAQPVAASPSFTG